jgi:predicted DNA binding CopG/RHH family protein
MKRKVPRMTTDEEAEAFVAQDLSDLDFSQFKPVRFEFQAKAARLNMRLPASLLDAVKAKANARGVTLYQIRPRSRQARNRENAGQDPEASVALAACRTWHT